MGFNFDRLTFPEERSDLGNPRAQGIVIGWAIVESGYGFGEINFHPKQAHPALVEFAALDIDDSIESW